MCLKREREREFTGKALRRKKDLLKMYSYLKKESKLIARPVAAGEGVMVLK